MALSTTKCVVLIQVYFAELHSLIFLKDACLLSFFLVQVPVQFSDVKKQSHALHYPNIDSTPFTSKVISFEECQIASIPSANRNLTGFVFPPIPYIVYLEHYHSS